MRKRGIVYAVLFFLFNLSAAEPQEIWVAKDGNVINANARAMLIDGGTFYLATKNAIYKSKDITDRWQAVFSIPSGENEINCIGRASETIFIGTKRGLFRSEDSGANWKKVFKAVDPERSCVNCIEIAAATPGTVLIGTQKGVFLSEDNGARWKDITENLDCRVRCLAKQNGSIYAGGSGGLFYRDGKSQGWKRVLVESTGGNESAGRPEEPPEEPEEKEGGSVACITINNARLYVGLDDRILYSDDDGKSWSGFTRDGLVGSVNSILVSGSGEKLYSATTKGVFGFNKEKARWLELYKGMAKILSVSNILFDSREERLWAITDNGIYRLEGGRYSADQYIDVEKNMKTLNVVFYNEPSFIELQQAAMKFAELGPNKIRDWRNQARMKALLPKVSFGIDKSSSTNYEIYTSATKDYVVAGPDDLSNGWDVSISWELADLVWSDDQTNIDVRSRLTTQLRNDVLDDLRRAYYERKRIQFELAMEPPKAVKAKFEKEMRLQELTQAIDDLTGNYLSRNIRKSDDSYSPQIKVHSP